MARNTMAALAAGGAAVVVVGAYALGTAGRGDAAETGRDTPDRTIVMSGQGTATGIPDELSFTVGVTVTRTDVATAMDESNRTMRGVLGSLKRFKVTGKDVQTTGLSIEPRYDYSGGTERLIGYAVSQHARATVHDLREAGKAMAAAAGAGGDAVRIGRVTLDISDRTRLLERARRAAVADATAKAGEYADASGERLGPVVSLREVRAPAPSTVAQYGALDDLARAYKSPAAVPIRAGKRDLDVRIRVVWSLG